MSKIIRVVLIIGLCVAAHAGAQAAGPPAALPIPVSGPLSLDGHLWYWVEPGVGHEAEAGAGPTPATLDLGQFQPLSGRAMPAVGPTVWLWFRLTHAGAAPVERLLNFEEVLFNRVQLYAPAEQPGQTGTTAGQPWRTATAGLDIPRSAWPVDYRLLALPVRILPGTHDYFVALHSYHWPLLAPELIDLETLAGNRANGTAIHTLALGIMVGLLLMALTIAFRGYRHPELHAFIGFEIFSLLLGLFIGGEMLRWLGGASHHFSNAYIHLISALALCALWMTRSLFRTAEWAPGLDRSLLLAMLGFVAVAAAGSIANFPALFTIQAACALFSFAVMTLTGIVCWRRRQAGGRSYTIAIIGYQLLALPAILGGAGWIPYSYWSRHGYEFATVAMSVLFAAAVSDKIQALQRRQDQLERRAIQADERSRAKGELLARMSHEIRTPINGVLGMTEVLHQTPLNLGQRRYLEVIASSGKLLLEIVNDILDYAKIEADRIELEHVPFALDGMLTQCVAIFLPPAHEKGLTFSVSTHPDTPLALIGDPTRCQQILNNLISNAVKFSNDSQVEVSVHSERLAEDRIRLHISVRDFGIGMAADQIQRLFQPFTQADGSTTRRYGGTGLGLSISRQLAQMMHGDITVDSESGIGTCFSMQLELEVDVAAEDDHRRKRALVSGRSMLLVYDHPGYGDAMERYFVDWGMVVRRARNRQEIHRELAAGPVDVIFSSSGLALEEPEALMNPLAAPIVLLQAMFDPPVRDRLAGTAVHYLDSPCTISDILTTLCQVMGLLDKQPETEAAQSDTHGHPLRVLVAEDNPVNRQVMGALLGRLGVDYQFADDGCEALERYQAEHHAFDLVLMDCEMPEMSGFDATRGIRRFEAEHDLPRKPVVAVTAHAMADGHQRCLAAGMDDMMVKPVNLQSLADLLETVAPA